MEHHEGQNWLSQADIEAQYPPDIVKRINNSDLMQEVTCIASVDGETLVPERDVVRAAIHIQSR